MMALGKTLLLISFSPLRSDARLLKQIDLFKGAYRLTTCGYGAAPEGVDHHIQIPDEVRVDSLNGRLITARLYSRAYWSLSGIKWARSALRDLEFDAVVANDVEAVPIANKLFGAERTHADLHEYSPRLHEEFPAWLRRIKPYYDWLCRRFIAGAASASTVSQGIADEYGREFGIDAVVVTNAAPFVEQAPTEVTAPIRLVHSGAGLRNRQLEIMLEAVRLTSADVTLDLYLTANDPVYIAELTELAREIGRVRVNPAVRYEQLSETLNAFDVGVFVLPPVNFGYEWTLPNKLFDFVQARLGVIVGPSPEMAGLIAENLIGCTAMGFTAGSLAEVFDDLTIAAVRGWKAAANSAARTLSSESQVAIWKADIATLVAGETV